jgi:DNA polymerase-3 subunit epsilon
MSLPRKKFQLIPQQGDSELDRTEFAVVDLETTGGQPDQERIIEIACFVAQGGVVTREFHTLVNPDRSIPPFITRLTGISEDMVHSHPPISDVLPGFLQFLNGTVFVAHHADFDAGFVRASLLRELGKELPNDVLCTRKLGKYLLPWLPSHSLSTIADFFGIEIKNRHRAFGDAYATTVILSIYLKYMAYQGIRELAQVHAIEQGRLALS